MESPSTFYLFSAKNQLLHTTLVNAGLHGILLSSLSCSRLFMPLLFYPPEYVLLHILSLGQSSLTYMICLCFFLYSPLRRGLRGSESTVNRQVDGTVRADGWDEGAGGTQDLLTGSQ